MDGHPWRSDILRAWARRAAGTETMRDVREARKYSDAELKLAFDAIDTDGSGDIDLDELRVAIQASI